jgi:hypothetical protein
VKLLNCKKCDDVLKLVDKPRSCECGQSTGRTGPAGAAGTETVTTSGPARIFEIPWQEYDQASGGEWQRWRLVKP